MDRKEQLTTSIYNAIKLYKSATFINISKVYIGEFISKILNFLTIILIIRNLTIHDYAQYTIFLTISSFLAGLVGAGLTSAIVRFSAEYISQHNTKPIYLYFLGFLFQIALYIISSTFIILVENSMNNLLFSNKALPESFYLGIIYGFGILMFQFGRSIYQAEEKFNTYIKITLIKDIIIFVTVLSLYFLSAVNFYNLAFSISVLNTFFGLFLTAIIFRGFSLKNKIVKTTFVLRDFISSTCWLILYFLILSLFQRLDIFMLSHFSTAEELANYGVAFRYYTMGLLILNAIHVVLLPKFSKIDYQDKKKQADFVNRWLKLTSWIIIPILIVDVIGKPIFLLINGAQYEKAFYIFVIFSIGIWLSLMFSPLVNVLMSRKEFKFLFLLAIGALIINFFGNYLLIQILGALGASIITVVSIGFINIYCFLYLIFFNK